MPKSSNESKEQFYLNLYESRLHAMQSGVAMQLEINKNQGTPKHLRVGINSAMVEHSALAHLLMDRGLFTKVDYFKAIAEQMKLEVESYEKKLSKHFNKTITLA